MSTPTPDTPHDPLAEPVNSPAPPTDDEREALIEILADDENYIWDENNKPTLFQPDYAADAILASPVWRGRPLGDPTEEETRAAALAYHRELEKYGYRVPDVHFRCMRAALEAARGAR